MMKKVSTDISDSALTNTKVPVTKTNMDEQAKDGHLVLFVAYLMNTQLLLFFKRTVF